MIASWQESYENPRQHVKKQKHHSDDKVPYSQGYGFSSSHVQMWELDHKEGWALGNWCFQTVVLEMALESPLGSKENISANPKGNQPWIFIGRTDAEAEAPILGPPSMKNWLIGKDSDAEYDWRQEEKEGGRRGWDGWMASSTQWTWVWANSGRQGRTRKPGVLQSMGSQSQTRLSDWTTVTFIQSSFLVPFSMFTDRQVSMPLC